MKIAHFVLTRLRIRDERMFGRLDGPQFGAIPLTSRTVDFRLKLLETVCLPGIRSQTSRDFTWVLLVDRALDAGVKHRLRTLAGGAKVRVHLHEYSGRAGASVPPLERLGWLEPLMAERPDYVLTTVADDDDALPRRFVEAARSRVLDLARRGALPPFGLLGTRQVMEWDMVFTPRAPLGWAKAPVDGLFFPASCGFSLLCRWPDYDFSVLGMRHKHAANYFDFRTPAASRNAAIYRRWFVEAARAEGGRRVPSGEDALHDLGPAAGAALQTNHGANLQLWRLGEGRSKRRRVLGAGTFPDVAVDWDALRRHAADFRWWRTVSRRLVRGLYGFKGRNVLRARRVADGMRLRLRPSRSGPPGGGGPPGPSGHAPFTGTRDGGTAALVRNRGKADRSNSR